jgi:Lar family restriction alleviation protein
MSEKLKLCPFCGGQAHLIAKYYRNNVGIAFVMCEQCKAESKKFPYSLSYIATDKAVESWNRRCQPNGSKIMK